MAELQSLTVLVTVWIIVRVFLDGCDGVGVIEPLGAVVVAGALVGATLGAEEVGAAELLGAAVVAGALVGATFLAEEVGTSEMFGGADEALGAELAASFVLGKYRNLRLIDSSLSRFQRQNVVTPR